MADEAICDKASPPASVPAAADFDDMGLSDELLRGVYAHGFERPTTVQRQGVPAVMSGRDTIIQAPSGMGKTGAFVIGALHLVDASLLDLQVLVLSPTHELADQSAATVRSIGGRIHGLRVHILVGGARPGGVRGDIEACRAGFHVASGTPGRVLHMLRDGHLDGSRVRLLVLDEADRMLDLGFMPVIHEVFGLIPKDVQVAMFSATMPDEALDFAGRFMRDPLSVLLKAEELPLERIRQYHVDVGAEMFKVDTLCYLYSIPGVAIAKSIVFVNRKRTAKQLADELERRDFTVSAIHSDLEEEERRLRMREFRDGASRVMIATDVFARGIDVPHVSLVVNFDLPRRRESYLHRIGRAGRGGRKGLALSFIVSGELCRLRDLERHFGMAIPELPDDVTAAVA